MKIYMVEENVLNCKALNWDLKPTFHLACKLVVSLVAKKSNHVANCLVNDPNHYFCGQDFKTIFVFVGTKYSKYIEVFKFYFTLSISFLTYFFL